MAYPARMLRYGTLTFLFLLTTGAQAQQNEALQEPTVGDRYEAAVSVLENIELAPSERDAAQAEISDLAAENFLPAQLLAAQIALKLDPPHYDEARDILEAASTSRNPVALARLASLLADTSYPQNDPARALELWREGADEGSTPALLGLARAYLDGIGTEADPIKAYNIFDQLAHDNVAVGLEKRGDLRRAGTGTAIDPEGAAGDYLRAGESGRASSWARFADINMSDELSSPDPIAAEQAYSKAIEGGLDYLRPVYARAHVNGNFGTSSDIDAGLTTAASVFSETSNRGMALTLLLNRAAARTAGIDIAPAIDYLEAQAAEGETGIAFQLLKASAEGEANIDSMTVEANLIAAAISGETSAMDVLMRFYTAQKDDQSALDLLEAAVKVGNADAMMMLSVLLSDPSNPSYDIDRATELRDAAAVQGNPEALTAQMQSLASNPDPVAEAKRIDIMQELAEQGDPAARNQLAVLLILGRGLPADPVKGQAMLQELAEEGDRTALVRLATFHRDGRGLAHDGPLARLEFLKAGELGANVALSLAQGDIEGSFGTESRPDEGNAVLMKALEDGVTRAALIYGNRLLEGHSVPDPEEVLLVLTAGVDEQNPAASKLLLSLIDSQPSLVTDSEGLRVKIMENLPHLDLPTYQFRNMVADLQSTALDPTQLVEVSKMMDSFTASQTYETLITLRRSDLNSYTFIIQEQLRKLGYYSGQSNGMLTASTIRAISRFCSEKGIANICAQGPLKMTAVTAVARALTE